MIRTHFNVSTLRKIGYCLSLYVVCAALLLAYTILKEIGVIHHSDVVKTYPWLSIISDWIVFAVLSVFLTSIIQFIYSQAPENMKGFTISIMWCAFSIASINSFIVTTNSYLKGKCSTSKHCEVYIMSALTLLSAVMFIIYCCVAKWYKRRERDELYNEHAIIEEIYGRHVEHNSIEPLEKHDNTF